MNIFKTGAVLSRTKKKYLQCALYLLLGWFSNRTGTPVGDGKARGKGQTRLPVPNLPLCHWSTSCLMSTDVPVLLLNQPIREFEQRLFWRMHVNLKWDFFPINMSWHYHMCIAKSLYSCRDDFPGNLVITTAKQWKKKHFRLMGVGQKLVCLSPQLLALTFTAVFLF